MILKCGQLYLYETNISPKSLNFVNFVNFVNTVCYYLYLQSETRLPWWWWWRWRWRTQPWSCSRYTGQERGGSSQYQTPHPSTEWTEKVSCVRKSVHGPEQGEETLDVPLRKETVLLPPVWLGVLPEV